MSKSELSEQDICSKYILPAVINSGWNLHSQIREQFTFTAGRIIVRGKTIVRGEKKWVDFILYQKNNGGGVDKIINLAQKGWGPIRCDPE